MRYAILLGLAISLRAQTDAPATGGGVQPPRLETTITVNERVASDSAAPITTLTQQDLKRSPGVNLDDRLRTVPGFSLFRRSSSLVANPTTQGVSLRALGATGASRTLLLLDEVPLNDPFGGWIYWTRVDPLEVGRIEVVRGASTSLFGDRAMGGAISIATSDPAPRYNFGFDYNGGNEGSNQLSTSFSHLTHTRLGISGHVRAFETNGYFVTPREVRGAVDQRANLRFAAGDTRLDYLGDRDRFTLKFDALAEERHNGTVLEHNSTSLGTISATYTHSWGADLVSLSGFHTEEQYHSTYASTAANRNTQQLTLLQTVPAQDRGAGLLWQHQQSRWQLVAGADVDDVRGTSKDRSPVTRLVTRSGGVLLQHGIFGQADYRVGPVQLLVGIRHQFTGLGDTFVSPNGGVVLGEGRWRVRASAYRSFRVPTLNELYRQFRVGNVLTLANARLVPEQLLGVEAGVDWTGESTAFSLTLFRNELDHFVQNVTLRTTPSLILRQRQNVPGGLSRGIEARLVQHWRHWSGELGYQFADARLQGGLRQPQIPKQQGTASLTYSTDSTMVTVGLRSYSLQFDDDLNRFALPGFAVLQLAAEQRLGAGFSATAEVDNLLDRQYLVALTPAPNTGSPQLWRVGLRWRGSFFR